MTAPDQPILQTILDWLAEGRPVALATVIKPGARRHSRGQQIGDRRRGNFLGSVSGGCVEASVVAEAVEVLETNKPKTLEFGVEDETAWSVGLACGGKIRIFVEPVGQAAMALGIGSVSRELTGDVQVRRPAALVT